MVQHLIGISRIDIRNMCLCFFFCVVVVVERGLRDTKPITRAKKKWDALENSTCSGRVSLPDVVEKVVN